MFVLVVQFAFGLVLGAFGAETFKRFRNNAITWRIILPCTIPGSLGLFMGIQLFMMLPDPMISAPIGGICGGILGGFLAAWGIQKIISRLSRL